MKAQKYTIIDWMKRNGSITQRQAWQLGIARLASRIHDLREMGIKIYTRSVCVRTRRGKAYITEYNLRKFEK